MNRKTLLFILINVLLFPGCGDQTEKVKKIVRPVRATQLSDTHVFMNIAFPGRAKATQEANLSFRVSGPLIELPVNIGDKVKTGDLLARIDPRDFEVALDNAKGQLSRTRAAFTRADKDYNRFLDIQKKNSGFISQSRVDMARAKRDEAKANIQSHFAAVKSAEDRLSYTYLKATFDGKIVAKFVKNYEFVNSILPVTPIVRLVDNSRIEMVISVPENKISLLPFVTGITVRFDSFPQHDITAQIKEVGTEASQTTRTYPVTLIMDQPDEVVILPGMAGNAYPVVKNNLTTESGAALTIPVTAVFSPTPDGKSYVWTIHPDTQTVSRHAVSLGELTNTGIPVIEGLKAGDWVVTAGVSYLHEGQQVKILQEVDQ